MTFLPAASAKPGQNALGFLAFSLFSPLALLVEYSEFEAFRQAMEDPWHARICRVDTRNG